MRHGGRNGRRRARPLRRGSPPKPTPKRAACMRPLYPFASFAEQSRKKRGATKNDERFFAGTAPPRGLSHRPRPRTGTGACPCGTPPRSAKQFLPSRSELIFIGRVNSSRIRAVEKPPRRLSALFGPSLLPGSERTLPHRGEGASARICRRWTIAPVGYAGKAARLPLVFQEVQPAGIGPSPGRGAGGAKCK